jgi:hypothetical protein
MNTSELEEIYVYTDSTGFPRSNEVSLAQTWPILLTETGVPSVIRGGGVYIKRYSEEYSGRHILLFI